MTIREGAQYLRQELARMSIGNKEEHSKAVQAIYALLNHYSQVTGEGSGPSVQQLWADAEKKTK